MTPIGKKYNIREADININGSKIKHVKCKKFLGITIHEHLDWKVHVDNLSNKIARNVGMLNKLKHFLPDYIMKTLYSSLIESHLQYCTLLWANSRVTHMRKLQLLQKKSHSYNHIISLHCTHRSTIRYDKTYEIRRSVQIPIRHIYA